MNPASPAKAHPGQALAPNLRTLDFGVLAQCIHCGLCLPTCPTYDATKLERNSPRGRIALMKQIAEGRSDVTKTFADEMYFCLGCLACQTACPAGVNYAEMFESARADVEHQRILENPKRNAIRFVMLRTIFMNPRLLRALGWGIWIYQASGMQSAVRTLGLTRLLPKNLRELEPLTPGIKAPFSDQRIRTIEPSHEPRRYRVGLLTGCVQDLAYPDINRDTADVLQANGCEVITPRFQSCCGSLHAHNGELGLARELARRAIDSFELDALDAIITNAGGCGGHLKNYAHLLHDDPTYATRAVEWTRKMKDIHEWLAEIGIRPPASSGTIQRVTYHESCHLSHGQKIVTAPRKVLQAIPGLQLIELPEASWCCGSAGIYNITQPEMSRQLLDRKMGHIKGTGVSIVATANPGCLVQLEAGARSHGVELRLVHPVSLLAEAYRGQASN